MENFDSLNVFENNSTLQQLTDIIDSIMAIPEEQLNSTVIESMQGMLSGAITPIIREQSIQQVLTKYKNLNYSRGQVKNEVESIKTIINNVIEDLKPSLMKRTLLDSVFKIFYDIFDEAANHYLTYDFELPITLEKDATIPTYAHETDAAADLYAADTVTLPAHSTSNMVRTGVHIGLPEGWMAMIFPRSSIGAKTGLRLSNIAGVIDSGYRGPLGVLYDNISDSDYTINAGDRIAQLLVMPSYHFRAEIVETLDDTDRGQGGFGSSGK